MQPIAWQPSESHPRGHPCRLQERVRTLMSRYQLVNQQPLEQLRSLAVVHRLVPTRAPPLQAAPAAELGMAENPAPRSGCGDTPTRGPEVRPRARPRASRGRPASTAGTCSGGPGTVLWWWWQWARSRTGWAGVCPKRQCVGRHPNRIPSSTRVRETGGMQVTTSVSEVLLGPAPGTSHTEVPAGPLNRAGHHHRPPGHHLAGLGAAGMWLAPRGACSGPGCRRLQGQRNGPVGLPSSAPRDSSVVVKVGRGVLLLVMMGPVATAVRLKAGRTTEVVCLRARARAQPRHGSGELDPRPGLRVGSPGRVVQQLALARGGRGRVPLCGTRGGAPAVPAGEEGRATRA